MKMNTPKCDQLKPVTPLQARPRGEELVAKIQIKRIINKAEE
jgi:hypothetical protein